MPHKEEGLGGEKKKARLVFLSTAEVEGSRKVETRSCSLFSRTRGPREREGGGKRGGRGGEEEGER